jgi:hypothetical protein
MAKKPAVGARGRTAAAAAAVNMLPPTTSAPSAPTQPPSPPPPQPAIGSANANNTSVWMPVDSYLIRHYGWQTADETGVKASIICYSSGVLVGRINFYDSGHVPVSTIDGSSPPQVVLTINFAVERVLEIMETLRRESPIHIGVDLNQRIGLVGIDPAPMGHVK